MLSYKGVDLSIHLKEWISGGRPEPTGYKGINIQGEGLYRVLRIGFFRKR